MNLSKIENGQPELLPNSEPEDELLPSAQVSANAVLPAVFSEWYATKLKVVGYPVLTEVSAEKGRYKDFDVFINVSDEYWMDYVNEFWKLGKQNHWFPMGEMHNDIGLVSIFGALWVMYQAYERNLSVLVHCHAGINRSQTVRACFHYMMTGEHLPVEMSGSFIKADNMLQYNCERNHLPELSKMELWLRACKEAFDNPQKFLGGMYDWTLRESGLALLVTGRVFMQVWTSRLVSPYLHNS